MASFDIILKYKWTPFDFEIMKKKIRLKNFIIVSIIEMKLFFFFLVEVSKYLLNFSIYVVEKK